MNLVRSYMSYYMRHAEVYRGATSRTIGRLIEVYGRTSQGIQVNASAKGHEQGSTDSASVPEQTVPNIAHLCGHLRVRAESFMSALPRGLVAIVGPAPGGAARQLRRSHGWSRGSRAHPVWAALLPL